MGKCVGAREVTENNIIWRVHFCAV
jgi:hypothetical protein